MMRRLAALLLVLLVVAPPAFARPPAPAAGSLGDVDSLVVRTMKAFDVPGVALAIVKDGRVVLAKGYGVRKVGEPETVDSETLFGIASNTKAFTCVALSILADEGRLSWDDPVSRHLPSFQMHDPWVTRELTVRDLVTHRSGLGLGAGDLMWWPPTTFTRQEIVAGIRQLKPASSLRTRYAYNNVMYVAAGEVVAAVSGRAWDAFVHERILQPLGMTHTTTSVSAGEAEPVAWPHLKQGGAQRAVPPMSFDNAAAAAGLNSTAGDLARWVRMLIECGRAEKAPPGETCLVKPESIRSLWTAQIALLPAEPPPGFEALKANFAGYGLGFGVRDYRGRKIVSHTGGLPGYVSRITLVPEERLGVVVLTNQEATGAFDAIVQHVLDRSLGAATNVDWVMAYRKRAEDERKKAEEAVARAAASRDAASRPSLPLARYAGRYADAWYGEAGLAEEGGRLVLAMRRTPGMVADLEHWQHDTFVARWRKVFMGEDQPADAYVSFALAPDATIERMTLSAVSPAIDFSFDYQDLLFRPLPEKR